MAHASTGPAGNGKTETIKDFAKKLGRWVCIKHCRGINKTTDLMKVVQGVHADTTWVVFDDFNLVLEDQMQNFMQELSVFMAARADKENGIFIKYNPGYAGRTQFKLDPKHWIANKMDAPYFFKIAQTKLATHGFLR